MILDSSPVVSMLLGEPGYEGLELRMRRADVLAIGAPTAFETKMVIYSALGEAGLDAVSSFRKTFAVVTLPYERHHEAVAMDAFKRFGKGRHPAALNILDCMTYATARVADEPLLFIGNDFAQTDIQVA
ncbi:MAG TPA: type II toxin-antitoxin system VapC family toxin [Solirubrobacterales bacterium]|nr:type II toxin-antitoxin system VapC family toxin [Solirubrobacterales bacterium]